MRDNPVADLSSPSVDSPPATADGLELSLAIQLIEAKARLKLAMVFLLSMAEGFREWRMPGRAAACENIANLLGDGDEA